MPKHNKVVSIDSFKGLDNRHLPEITPSNYLKRAENIDISSLGSLSKREGYTKIIDGSVTSLWSSSNGLGCYAVIDNNLVRIFEDNTYSLIRSSVGSDKLVFIEIDDTVYYVSPSIRGSVRNGVDFLWGINKNITSPQLSLVQGSLPKGTYQVCFTLVSNTGIESGSGLPSYITISSNSNIQVTVPNIVSQNIALARVYCSTADGTTMYYIGDCSLGTTFSISDISTRRPLKFSNIDAPPFGNGISYYKGRIYITSENILWYSEPYQYHHFNLAYNYIEFPEDIVGTYPSEDGIWVASDKLYYLVGDNPDEFLRVIKEQCSVVKGTEVKVAASYLVLKDAPPGHKWMVTSDIGILVLYNQGILINLTSDTVDLDRAKEGSAILIKNNGNVQYLTILNKEEEANNTSVGDLVEAKIIRNNVIIQ